MTGVHQLTRRWNRFFFAPDAAENLAVCRILFYGGLLALNWHKDFAAWGQIADVFWMPEKCWPFEYFNIPLLAPPILGLMSVAWKVSLGLSCLGLLTRLSSVMSFVLGFYLLGLPHCFGDLAHGDAAAVLILGVMTLARSGDALSLDSTLWPRSVASSGEYRWPVRTVWLILSTVFFAAGYAKLSQGGLGWAFSDNMSFILAEHQFPPEHPEALIPWGKWMARQSWLARGLGLATLILETGYPLAMFSRRARFIFVPGMLLSVVGFRVLLGPSFFPLILCHVFWVRWWPQKSRVMIGASSQKPHLTAG
ncbi:MAG: hypothetical protein AAF152_00490 [Cyanobacteria bacterium P01_A01_bin.114]